MDIEIHKLKRINFLNVLSNKSYVHILEDEHKNLSIIDWHILREIIELYEPRADINKLVMQAKVQNKWKYITNSYSINVRTHQISKLEIRYKIYDMIKINQTQRQREMTQKKLNSFLKDFKKYEQQFNLNITDINLVWASPIYALKNRRQKRLQVIGDKLMLKWRICCQSYIKQIAQTLSQSKKRVYVENKLFNQSSFKNRNSYCIVYILCHTQTYTQSKGEDDKEIREQFKYFAGETDLSCITQISPQTLEQMIGDKSIKLLILHSSYPYYHLDKLRACEGISNILLINSNPSHNVPSTTSFLKAFFTYILQNRTIKQSHELAMQRIDEQYPNDQICCCYHSHFKKQCVFSRQLNYTKYSSTHYKFHYAEKNKDMCCAELDNFYQKHNIHLKYSLISKDQFSKQIYFQFESGELQGDGIYLTSFKTRQNLLKNQPIYIKALQVYNNEKIRGENKNKSVIFNIYTKINSIKQSFADHLANFLIRRKIFKINKMQTIASIDFDGINLYDNTNTLYTIICDKLSPQEMVKLSNLGINAMVISDMDLNFKSLSQHYGSAYIQPLNNSQCNDYIKAQKHLDPQMKGKVGQFFSIIWDSKKPHTYYTTNFDYDGLISVIAQSNYKDSKKFFQLVQQNVNKQKFLQYILTMSVLINLQNKQLEMAKETFSHANFYLDDSIPIEKKNQFIGANIQNFHLVYQKYHKDIGQILFPLMASYVKLTKYTKNKLISLYDATTDSYKSLFHLYFRRNIEKCEEIYIEQNITEFMEKLDVSHIFKAALTLVRYIATCFYFYDVLDLKQQIDGNNIQPYSPTVQDTLPLIKNRKKQILVFCLLIINNAVIHRKHNGLAEKNQLQKNKKEQMTQQIQFNCHHVRKYFSHQPVMQPKLQKRQTNFYQVNENQLQKLQKYSSKQTNQLEVQQELKNIESYERDPHRHTAESLSDKTIYYSREGLLKLLQKIKEKKSNVAIKTVTQNLSFQLIFQKIYSGEIKGKSLDLKNVILRQIFNIKRWNDKQLQGKLRSIYDLIMLNILIQTSAGKQKLSLESFDCIKSNYKIAVDLNIRKVAKVQTLIPSPPSQKLQFLQKLCSQKEISDKLLEYIKNCTLLNHNVAEQKLISGFLYAVDKWQQFSNIQNNQKLKPEQKQIEIGKSYLKLIKLNNQLQTQIATNSQISSYAFNMLNDLNQKVKIKIQNLTPYLIVVLVASPLNQKGFSINKFVIDYENFIKQKIPQTTNHCIVKINLNSSNLKMLSKWGCRYLILNICMNLNLSSNCWVGENESTGKAEYIKSKQLAEMLKNIKYDYLYLCLLKSNQLREQIQKTENKSKIVYFQLKKSKLQIDEAQKMVFMLISSVLISQLHIKMFDMPRAIQDITSNLQIRFVNNQQIPPYANNKLLPTSKILLSKQIKQIIVLDKNENNVIQKPYFTKQIVVQVPSKTIIKQNYLTQIQSIHALPNITDFSNLNGKNLTNCTSQNFIQFYTFYMKEKQGLQTYVIEDSKNQSTQFFQKLVPILPTYYLNDNFILLIKNYDTQKLPWMKKVLRKYLFAEHKNNNIIQNKCIQIKGQIFIISIKRCLDKINK